MKDNINRGIKRIAALAVIVSLVLCTAPVECIRIYTYAADNNDLYDTVPVFQDGSEGNMVKARLITVTGNNSGDDGGGIDIIDDGGGIDVIDDGGGIDVIDDGGGIDVIDDSTGDISFYFVQLPENTQKIRFYGGDATEYSIPDSELPLPDGVKGKVFKSDDYANDGWWTIDVADLKWNWIYDSNTYKYGLLKSEEYCSNADYYELINNADPDKHVIIQIGDESSPLDVLAAYDKGHTFAGDWHMIDFDDGFGPGTCKIQLTTGKRGEPIDSVYEIYYTLNGNDPSIADTAIQYTEPFKITRSCTIKAAVKISDMKWGPVCEYKCTIESDSPKFVPDGGYYSESQTVSILSGNEDATIYYTLDGTNPVKTNGKPNNNAVKYEAPIVIDKDTTIKAAAVTNDAISAVISAEYVLSTGIGVSFLDSDQGVWFIDDELHYNKKGVIVTPYNREKCKVVITAAEGATLKKGDVEITRETGGTYAGKFIVELDAREYTKQTDLGEENKLTVINGDRESNYTIYCIASKYSGRPDKVTDYFIPASQYTNNGYLGAAPNRTLVGKYEALQASSLGNFGGYITWYYKDGIKDDPKNSYGVDFIVFGNSFDGTNEAAEPGNIMVSEDGKKWYTIAGSIHYDNNAIWNQKVTYTRTSDGLAQYNFEGLEGMSGISRFLYPDLYYYPLHGDKDAESFTTSGTFLIPADGLNAYGNVRPPYAAFGYADTGLSVGYSNEADNPYGGIVRDETYTERVSTERNGDPCDIAWAVDESGKPVQLNEIHYIKVQTASFIDNGAIGEKSTEVNGMRIAKPSDSAVGVTAAPASIKIDGTTQELKPGEMVDADVSGVFDIVVDAPEDANVYINSLKSHTAYMNEAPHGIVRVIVQEGEKEPLIYYFNINQSADSKTVTKVTLDPGKGLLWDKEKVDCYFDEDTFAHAEDGKIELPEATPAKDTQGFVFWQDADGNSYDAYDASLLGKAELTLQAKFAKKADAEAVKSVWKLINALPEATDVTADDIEAILEAGEAYDALTDDQKALVGDKLLQKLTDDENAIVTLVNSLIDALPAADNVTLEDAEQIETAAAAYDVLTDEGKALVTNYTKLLEAQLKLVELKLDEANAALEQEQLDNEAKVKKLEDTISDLTNELTDTVAKLDKAEKEDIPALQEEIADLQKKLEQTRKELAEARKALIDDSFGQLIEAAQKALDDAKAELSAAGDSIVNKALKALVETAEKALEAAKAKADDANRAMSESAKEIAALRDQVAQASQELAKAGEELAKAVASGAASEKEISELKDKVAEAEAAKAAAEKTAAEAAQGKQTSDDELAKTKAALAEAEAALADLKAKIAASELKVVGLKVKSKSKKFTVTWKKNASADGYKVQYRLKGKKYKTLKEVTKLKAVSKKLKKGKKYQFRVATYKTVNGKKIYGKWSKVKTVKCK